MNDWTASEAKEFLDIIRAEAKKAAQDVATRQSAVYSCMAVVTDVSESGAITVRLLSSPSDGSQDFVVRNRSGSVLEVGDSVWLHYWSDYTNVYVVMRNDGDVPPTITPASIGAASATHVSQHAIGGADPLNAMPHDVMSTNLLINGGFDIWQRALSFASPYSGQYVADRWRLDYTGTGATRTISRQAFGVGQTDVPGNPAYFLSYNQSVAGSGGTFNMLRQCVENVLLLSGKTVTLSFYARATSPINIFTYASQIFGSGGSADTGVSGDIVEIGSSWSKYTQTFVIPSVFGKTIGVGNFTYFGFSMPNNATFTIDIATAQVNYGAVALPFVQKPYGETLRDCQRYYQILPSFWSTTVPSTGHVEIGNAVFPVPMRVAPNVVINSQPNTTGTDGYIDRYGVGSVSLSGASISATNSALLSITKTGAFVTTALYRGSAQLDSEL